MERPRELPSQYPIMSATKPAKSLDLRLYAIVDPEQSGGCAATGAPGGARWGNRHSASRQEQHNPGDDRARKKSRQDWHCSQAGGRPFSSMTPRCCAATSADGVHLGQDDMGVEDARRLLGPAAIIGLSVKTIGQAAAAPLDELDYVGIGGVFATTSKNNPGAPIGAAGLARVIDAVRTRAPDFPVCAIAGISAKNAAEVIAAGADGVAVITALAKAPDPEAAARELCHIVDAALCAHGRK